jgi:photosystem II stability/assembly factor-like uncharacterized protein
VRCTRDAGLHWSSSTIPAAPPAAPADLEFADPRHGWLVIDLGAAMGHLPYILWRTTDGGAHWTRAAYDTFQTRSHGAFPGCDCSRAITFRDPVDGWSTGAPFATPQQLWLYRTADGGRTWTHQALSGLGRHQIAETFPPRFVGGGIGYLPVRLDAGQPHAAIDVYRTGDGGRTWHATSRVRIHAIATSVAALARYLWIADGSVVYRSSDGGARWSSVRRTGWTRGLDSLQFLTPRLGYAVPVCDNGCSAADFLLVSRDGGRSWTRAPSFSASRPLHG